PLVGRLLWRHEVAPRVFAAAGVALVGLALITLQDGPAAINGGDMLVLVTALTCAVYIVYLGEVARKVRGTAMAFMQLPSMALLAWGSALPQVAVVAAVPVAAYIAIISMAVVATALVAVIQTFAQRVVPAHLTALIFLLEPAFAALSAYLTLGE